jgi:hypothetical protein
MRVFISYTAADEGFARRLRSHLSRRGCRAWLSSEQLFPGDNWLLKTGEALQQSKAMVVLLSPDSIKSEWMRREVEYAIGDRNYKGRVFPVVVRPTDEVPWILRKFPILRANNNPAEISKRIATALRREA